MTEQSPEIVPPDREGSSPPGNDDEAGLTGHVVRPRSSSALVAAGLTLIGTWLWILAESETHDYDSPTPIWLIVVLAVIAVSLLLGAYWIAWTGRLHLASILCMTALYVSVVMTIFCFVLALNLLPCLPDTSGGRCTWSGRSYSFYSLLFLLAALPVTAVAVARLLGSGEPRSRSNTSKAR